MGYEIVPNTTRLVCGENSAYGLATVRDTDHPDRPPVDVRVDTNWNDGTEQPRIILPNGTSVDIDDEFLSAYQRLQRGEGSGTPDQQTACREMGEARGRSERRPISWGYAAIPLTGAALEYVFDRYGRHDMSRIPTSNGFGTLGTVTEIFYVGAMSLFAVPYSVLHRRWSSTVAWINDGLCMGAAVGFGVAAAVQPRGDGTPELSMALTLGSTCGPAMVYGNIENSQTPIRFWSGFGVQLVISGVLLGLGAGGVGRSPQDELIGGESGIYAPPDLAPGTRDLHDENPYGAAPFPGIDRDMLEIGAVGITSAAANLIDYLVVRRRASGDDSTRLSVGPMPEGIAGFSISGTF